MLATDTLSFVFEEAPRVKSNTSLDEREITVHVRLPIGASFKLSVRKDRDVSEITSLAVAKYGEMFLKIPLMYPNGDSIVSSFRWERASFAYLPSLNDDTSLKTVIRGDAPISSVAPRWKGGKPLFSIEDDEESFHGLFIHADEIDDGVKEDDLHIRTRGLSLKDAPFKEPPGPRSNLIKFWDAIASIPFESHARELVLPDGVAFFNRETLGGRIFIRDCFAALFESMLPFLTDRPGVVVLTGVPGTGKSHFAAYVAWRLANMPSIKQIVYTRDPQKSDSFDLATRTITSSYTVSDERPAISNFRGCEHVHIVDILDVVPPKDFFGSTFIFSSPNRIRYKESLKHKNSIRFIMPLWTLDEIHAAREGFFPNVSKELADEIFEMYGGVPRFVLEKASTAKTAMTEALASVKSFQNILDVLQTGGAEKLDTEMSYKILHIAPKCINADSSPRVYDFLDSPVYSFASRWVAHEIFERQEDAMIMELKRCILNSRAVNELGGIRGVMFGEFAHSLLVKIDCVYNMRRLGEAADEADRLRLPHFKKLTRFDGKETPLSALSADDYIYPVSKNYPSVDAFAKVGRILYLFQMTVSDQHPVLGAPIVKIIEDFGCGVGPKMGLDEVHLIFVRPKMDSVTLFKLQSILNDDKKAYTRMPSGLAKVQQWECALDLF